MFKRCNKQVRGETGKTMIDTLMALVIMGVLTAVSFTLYTFLVHRWETIETLDLINKSVAGVRTGSFAKYLEEQSEQYIDTPDYLLSEEAMPVDMYISGVKAPSMNKQDWYSADSFEAPRGTVVVTYPAVNGDGVVVGMHQLPKELCEEVLKHDLGWDYALRLEKGENGYQPKGEFIKYAEMDVQRRAALCEPVVDHISAEINVSDLGLAFNLSEGEDRPDCPECTREFLGRCVQLEEAKCGENQELYMPTCQCYCKYVQAGVKCCAEGEHDSNGHCCPEAKEWDNRTNSCKCPDCSVAGMSQDPETCECECPSDTDPVLQNGQVVLCCPDGTVPNHDNTKCITCPEGNDPPNNRCYTTQDYPATLDCPSYTIYTEEACECSSGYGKTACVEGSQYETATETLRDGTVCYKCADCPTGNEKPTNACYTEVTTPADATTGCPAYTTYTSKACDCPSGFSATVCASGSQYATETKTLADGTMCYKCTNCPTGNKCPENSCCTETLIPPDTTTGCLGYVTSTKTDCTCPVGTFETCKPHLESKGGFMREDGVLCHSCGCAEGTVAYKNDKKLWKPNTESDVQDEIGYCCSREQPLPSDTLGKCGICDTDIKCDPAKEGSDCPENSFCFNSGDSHGWHCHYEDGIEHIWTQKYGVRSGGGIKIAWQSGQKHVAEQICGSLGKIPWCQDGLYSWGHGKCLTRSSSGNCIEKSDKTCDNKKPKINGYEGKGGLVICY